MNTVKEYPVKKKQETRSRSALTNKTNAVCKVESVISVDERGQMVLPKELREKAGIKAGDKLAVTSWEKNGEVCCITLIKVEDMVEMVKVQLGPILKEIL
ncbi:MAG: AbrB/MazE/SpoVT family DNA-binding domain-containing protein [Nitrospirae bacterium]|nr:AbrB/MazE/SpoVT family DNA-binding domain-containing protein [Nitrospirota bacterium]